MRKIFSKKELIFEIHNWNKEDYESFKEAVIGYVKKHYNDVHIRERQKEAIQWTGKNEKEIHNFLGKMLTIYGGRVQIETLEGTMEAKKGDWIIKGVKGEVYPCKPDIFERIRKEKTEK